MAGPSASENARLKFPVVHVNCMLTSVSNPRSTFVLHLCLRTNIQSPQGGNITMTSRVLVTFQARH